LGLAALALLDRIAQKAAVDAGAPVDAAQLPQAKALGSLADELWRHRGESLVVCGLNDVAVQQAVNRINVLLGNVGRTIDLDNPSYQAMGDEGDFADLVAAMERGEIGALFLYGVNPAYDYPAAAHFLAGLEKVALKVSFADRVDETAGYVDALCPDHHYLEAWNDAR